MVQPKPVTETVTIPASVDDAVNALGGIERLLTVKEWERSAILAAFVEVTKQGKVSSDFLSPEAFAAKGIAGLKSKTTVAEYVKRWQDTGRPRPKPGEVVDLSGLPEWKKPDPGAKYGPGKDEAVRRITEQPATVAAALADPAFMQKVAGRLTADAVEGVTKTVLNSRPEATKAAKEVLTQHAEDTRGTRTGLSGLTDDFTPPDVIFGQLQSVKYLIRDLRLSVGHLRSKENADRVYKELSEVSSAFTNLVGAADLARDAAEMVVWQAMDDERGIL